MLTFLVFICTIMKRKLVETRHFRNITVKNWDYRPQTYERTEKPVHVYGSTRWIKRKHYFRGRGEKSELYINWELKACGYYTRQNRPRQRFDFCESMRDAMKNALGNMNWKEYEQNRKAIQELKELVRDY